MTAGALVVFLLFLSKMYKPIRELSKMTDTYSRALVAFERINGFLAVELEVRDRPGAKRAPRFRGTIELDHVTFAYGPDRPNLADVSLTIPAGSIASAGRTDRRGEDNAHQSHRAVLRPAVGPRADRRRGCAILLPGIPPRTHELRVTGHAALRGPVWQNIAYGRPEATRGEIAAAELANADAFIRELPDGYNTMVGERGVTLSGGQQQRIAIARAIMRDAPILVLDEPTTGLDASSEALVLDALRQLMRGKTTIMIAHSLATVQQADQIFVIDHGRVCERGTHATLVAASGVYARLHDHQFNRSISAASLQPSG